MAESPALITGFVGLRETPLYRETGLAAEESAAVRAALQRILAGHEPYPAVVLDRH
ncbi:MAG TPA: hypothetical protein VGM79_33315 [Streptosporangiaceae bacterium]